MKFCCTFSFIHPDHYLELAQLAEAHGWDSVLMSDHVVHPETIRSKYPYSSVGERAWTPETAWPDVWVATGMMAAVTTRLRFMQSVYVLPMRDPFSVAKALGTAMFKRRYGNVAKGEAAVRRWLLAKGLNFPELVIENGAGLSRIERLSAQHLGELLLSAANSPYAAELEASLPIPGVDGTLKRRLNDRSVAGRAHIKTGSLEGVRAIAGFVLDAKGRKIVVVFLINHSKALGAQAAQDALLDWVYGRL